MRGNRGGGKRKNDRVIDDVRGLDMGYWRGFGLGEES